MEFETLVQSRRSVRGFKKEPVPRDPGAVCHFDLGALCYGIVLAAWDRGLGSVINGQGIMRSDIVREVANIPEDEVIMTLRRAGLFRRQLCRECSSLGPRT